MTDILVQPTGRRAFLGSISLGGAALALAGCQSFPALSLTDAIQRLLYLSSERAFDRMLQQNGFWDQQIAQLGLDNVLGARGGVLNSILTSALFKDRLYDAFGEIAYRGAARAAPIVTDAVRVIGVQGAIDLVNGGPRSATSYLRGQMGTRLIEAMVPELGDAMRVASDPLVGQALSALAGVNVPQVANRVATSIDNTIWGEIGNEEAEIRRDPGATRDPVLIGVFRGGAALR
ncbi:DUF4197 domain-containing protein [Erythrobacter litoralis]|uniref:DUF4197 domain-containing protein n=1 Tax=Erythrobacter litoralis TaxID=39960 RepID=UPI002434BA96|nr:DUF4197 domain-containing protein [Erythrobacter litoralis]MDG6078589.1 DUF4197 domain-containing protein [Erythrobacter litoralis]